MDRKTINSVLRSYLKDDLGMEAKEATKLIKKFHSDVENTDEDDTRLRHGTTCFGIIDTKNDETVIEM